MPAVAKSPLALFLPLLLMLLLLVLSLPRPNLAANSATAATELQEVIFGDDILDTTNTDAEAYR